MINFSLMYTFFINAHTLVQSFSIMYKNHHCLISKIYIYIYISIGIERYFVIKIFLHMYINCINCIIYEFIN